jgi:hypothetical protein
MERKFSKQQRGPSAPSECVIRSSQLDPDINYPALIPIITHAYLLLTLRPMHALSSLQGINLVTYRTYQARYSLTVPTHKTRSATTDAQLPRRAPPLVVYNLTSSSFRLTFL